MIVYQSTKSGFSSDVRSNKIDEEILGAFRRQGYGAKTNEISAYKNSMLYMENILQDSGIPDDCGVMIEYQIPQSSKRIDFIVTGLDENHNDQVVIVELKQWEKASLTDKDGLVSTFVGQAVRETNHPSYQAWSYSALLEGFNEAVYSDGIKLHPCAYLHNYISDGIIDNDFYSEYINKAPLFLRRDAEKLQNFIKHFVRFGDNGWVMYRIEKGRIRPSKSLADSLSKMLKGNQEFIMIDDQKVVYENALSLAKKSSVKNKNVLLVQGGPGTGKSVVAINLLVALTKIGLNTRYVTKNAAPRAVYESMLTGTLRHTEFVNLFSGSGSFVNAKKNIFDVLVVDEAHRLNEKSGMYHHIGENQVKEIIEASKFSVFFIDEDQKVTWQDIGEKDEIIKWAKRSGAEVHELELASQFRCNGSDGYLAWLDDILQIRETANTDLEGAGYDFQVVDSPNKLKEIIFKKNKEKNKARLVAGYCWDWDSKRDKNLSDIVIPEHNFAMKWNLASDGSLWILKPESVNEVGCIHTCQGLELDYVGVIVGQDFVIRDGKVTIDPSKRAKTDASLKGYGTLFKRDPEAASKKADAIIKNTYRTLMTRGMKGCYVYFVDKETERFFRSRLKRRCVYASK